MANKAKSVNKTLVTTLLIVQSPVYPVCRRVLASFTIQLQTKFALALQMVQQELHRICRDEQNLV